MKKRLSVLLAVAMLFSVMIPIVAFANVHTANDSVSLLQEGDYDIYETDVKTGEVIDGASLVSDAFYNEVYNGLISLKSKISLSKYRVTLDDFKIVYSNIINENPELFYVSSSYSYQYSGNYIYTVTPRYVLSTSEIESAKVIFNNGINKALSTVDTSMTDVQKVLTIHDYFCEIARYPKLDRNPDLDIYHSAYGIFYNGDTVCAGYTLAFSAVMKELGIPCYYVSSTGMAHAWNAVYVDNAWYYIDLTFDDIGYYGDYNTLGAMQHRCFLKSQEMLSSEYCFIHFDYQQPSEVDCSSTKYDDYFWNDINSSVKVIDGDYYYIKPNMSTRYASLVKRDVSGNESMIVNNSFYFTSMSLTSITVDEQGVEHNIPITDPLIRLSYCDDRFYVGAYNILNSVSFTGEKYEIYKYLPLSSSNMIIGMGVVDGDVSTQLRVANGVMSHNRMDYFNSYFTTGGKYNNYADKNNDGYINARDYLLIKNRT